MILEYLVKERSDMELATVHCSANLLPSYVINKISQLCIVVNTNKGKVYKPKKGNLLLYFKNLHLLKPDKWGTNILIEFLHQVRSEGRKQTFSFPFAIVTAFFVVDAVQRVVRQRFVRRELHPQTF